MFNEAKEVLRDLLFKRAIREVDELLNLAPVDSDLLNARFLLIESRRKSLKPLTEGRGLKHDVGKKIQDSWNAQTDKLKGIKTFDTSDNILESFIAGRDPGDENDSQNYEKVKVNLTTDIPMQYRKVVEDPGGFPKGIYKFTDPERIEIITEWPGPDGIHQCLT